MVYIENREQDLRLGRNRMYKGDGCDQPNRAGELPARNASISKPMVGGMKLSVLYNSPLHTLVVSGVRRRDWTGRLLGSHGEQPYRYHVGTYLATLQYSHVFTSQTYFLTLNFQGTYITSNNRGSTWSWHNRTFGRPVVPGGPRTSSGTFC
jgi:hypothetical protein